MMWSRRLAGMLATVCAVLTTPGGAQTNLSNEAIWGSNEFGSALVSITWAPDGRHVDFAALIRTDSHIFRLDVASGEVQQHTEMVGNVGGLSFDRGHQRVAFVHAAPTSTNQIYTMDLGSGTPRQLTQVNEWLAERIVAMWRTVPKEPPWWICQCTVFASCGPKACESLASSI